MVAEILIMKLKDTKHYKKKEQEKELNCIFIRTNPDEKYFKILEEINKIHRHIKKSLMGKI